MRTKINSAAALQSSPGWDAVEMSRGQIPSRHTHHLHATLEVPLIEQ